MSDKTIEGYGKGYLVLLLPISFLIVFLIATWRVWLAIIFLGLGFKIWQRYQWQSWCGQINPIFNQMLRENQGKITPIELAMRCNFSGSTAKRYLDTKADEFGVIPSKLDNSGPVYYFLTAGTLANIFDSSEPPAELKPAVSRTATSLLAPPPPQEKENAVVESESTPPSHQETKPLEKQLVFGSLIQSELAQRLNVYSSTVYKRRNDPNFPEWSRNRDPDGVAWVYSHETKEFFPEDPENQS